MEYNKFFEKLGIEKPDSCFEEKFAEAYVEYDKQGVFFLEDEFIEKANSFCDCLSNCYNEIQKAAALARKNNDIALYALFVYRAMMDREKFKTHLSEFVFPKGETAEYDFLPMLILLPVIPTLYERLKEHCVPNDIIEETLRQFEACIYLYEERFDKPGLHKHYFDHLQLYVDAKVLNIDRLRFEMVEKVESPILVLKNEQNELAVLFDGAEINSKGLIYGTPPDNDNGDSFFAEVCETAEYFEGYRAQKNGRCDKEKKRFYKKEWKEVLKKGDSVLSVHIPNKGALTQEACEKSYERARNIFKKCYPDFKYKSFYCHTWLFDLQLEDFLSPNSNILNFRKKFTLFAGETEGRDVFNFVFKLRFKEFKDMPENTSLQRAIKKHYLDGKYIYEFEGVFL